MTTTKQLRGTKVYKGPKGKRKIGKIQRTVFHPEQPCVVGFIIKRPDFLFMIKRHDRFLAFDACAENEEGRLVASASNGTWDESALKRLDIDYDKCILWENMPIRSEDGEELGRVGAVVFDDETGRIEAVNATDGNTAKALLGNYEIPLKLCHGYEQGFLVVDDSAANIEASGGLAAKAGAATAKATKSVTIAGKKAGDAVNSGAYTLGKGIGKAKSMIDEKREKGSIPEEIESVHVEEARVGKDDESAMRYSEATSESSSDEMTEPESTDKPSGQVDAAVQKAAHGLGEQLGKTKGMFAAFKEEYKKGSEGDE